MKFNSVKKLVTHFVTFHSLEARECFFQGCSTSFKSSPAERNSKEEKSLQAVARRHFRTKHSSAQDQVLKESYRISLPSRIVTLHEEVLTEDVSHDTGAGEGFIDTSIEMNEVPLEELHDTDIEPTRDENYFFNDSADYYNRLVNFKFVPQSTVQEIAVSNLRNLKMMLEAQKKRLERCLVELPYAISETEKEKVVKEVVEDDWFLLAQSKLSSEYKRTRYVTDHMQYVEPKELVLNSKKVKEGAKKDVLHYVPVTQSIKALLEDETLNKLLLLSTDQKEQGADYAEVKHGNIYKTNRFFKENPNAIGIILYSDAVEIKAWILK